MSKPKSPLDQLIGEAKEDLVPRDGEMKWDRIEQNIMARVREEEPALLRDARAAGSGRARAMKFGAIALAAAAAALIVVGRDRGDVGMGPGATVATAPSEPSTGGALRSTEGEGEVLIGGTPAAAGHALHAGDIIEAKNARGVVERPRKVTWLIEQDADREHSARAVVKSAGEPLVLGLEHGAIEAQVVPVPSGEAFAVDVASGSKLVRVAVHGTHLRVVRDGTRVTVDLTEGVVSIGVPPRAGSTYGTLVTAPAHVELDAADLEHTLRVDHAIDKVRAAISLAAHEPPPPATTPLANLAPGAVTKPSQPTPAPIALAPAAPKPQVEAPAVPAMTAEPPKVLAPRDAIASAVKSCAASRARAGEVHITVSSTLRLKLNASGDVESAVFDPPLLPAIQECAAPAIYKTKIEGQGNAVTVPIEFAY